MLLGYISCAWHTDRTPREFLLHARWSQRPRLSSQGCTRGRTTGSACYPGSRAGCRSLEHGRPCHPARRGVRALRAFPYAPRGFRCRRSGASRPGPARPRNRLRERATPAKDSGSRVPRALPHHRLPLHARHGNHGAAHRPEAGRTRRRNARCTAGHDEISPGNQRTRLPCAGDSLRRIRGPAHRPADDRAPVGRKPVADARRSLGTLRGQLLNSLPILKTACRGDLTIGRSFPSCATTRITGHLLNWHLAASTKNTPTPREPAKLLTGLANDLSIRDSLQWSARE